MRLKKEKMTASLRELCIFKISEEPFKYLCHLLPQDLQKEILINAYILITDKLQRFEETAELLNNNNIFRKLTFRSFYLPIHDKFPGNKHYYFKYYKPWFDAAHPHKRKRYEEMEAEMSKRSMQQSNIQGSKHL